MTKNSFVDLGVGVCGQAWAIRQNDTNSADAAFDWWNTTGPEASIQVKIGQGAATVAPWISAYTDDPSHAGQTGFWPLASTTTSIASDTPDPTVSGQAYTVSGTVNVTGLGGVVTNLASLPGQVVVSDGSSSCTATSITDSGTLNQYNFACTMTSTSGSTLTATYSDTTAVPFYDTSNGTAAHTVFPCPSISTANTTSLTGVLKTIGVTTTDMTGRGAISADFTFSYNDAVLSPASISAGPAAGSGLPVVTWRTPTSPTPSAPGTVIVSVYNTGGFTGTGDLVNLTFNVIGPIGSTSGLNISNFLYNGGYICTTPPTNGTLTIISGTISGRVTYVNSPGPIIPVRGVVLDAPGTPHVTGTTDASGNYSLNGFGPASYTVTPSKAAYAPGNSTPATGIQTDDATAIVRSVVGLDPPLTGTRLQAAKVSGNLTPALSSFDAALIAQWVVGINNPQNLTGQWKFFTPANGGSFVVNADVVQDYTVNLMGDANQSWGNLAGSIAPPANLDPETAKNSVRASITNIEVTRGSALTVPVRIDNLQGRSVGSYQFDVEYDPAVIEPSVNSADLAGTVGEGLNVVFNVVRPGLLKVAVYGAMPVTGDGAYVNLRFSALGQPNSRSPLSLRSFYFNGGESFVVTADGSVSVTADPNTGARR